MRRSHVVIAVVLGLVSASVWYDTGSYPESLVPGAPGGAAFPRALAASLFVLASVLLVEALRKGGEPAVPESWEGVGKNGTVLALLVVFVLLAGAWDFYLLLCLLVAATMAVMGERRKRALLGLPILFGAFVYVVFHRVLGVDFPSAYW